jgi:EmrB/QacA subfamily drug resistance transporter
MSQTATQAPPATEAAGRRRWMALVLLCLAQFMLILDITAVNVALPGIGSTFHLGRDGLTWTVTAYTLCFGSLMILGGRLADALGPRRTVLGGLAIFAAASAATGLAGNEAMLIGGRVAQGAGAAILSPSALALVTVLFQGAERGKALGAWAGLAGAGSALGNVIGGALTAGPGWRWIFYVNLPVAVIVLAALPAIVAARPGKPARVDVPGALLVTAGTAALIYGMVKAGDSGWGSAPSLVSFGVAAAAYALFAVVERRASAPLLEVRMFTRRPVLAGAFLMLTATGLLFGFFFLGSIYLQSVRGWSALSAGLLFLPMAAGAAAGAHLGGHLAGTIGPRKVAAAALALVAIGSVLLAQLDPRTSPWLGLLPGLVIGATGIGATFVTATSSALANVPEHEAGLASAVISTFHEVGGAVGVALLSTVATVGIVAGTTGSFGRAFTISAAIAGAAALVALVLVPRGRAELPEGMPRH